MSNNAVVAIVGAFGSSPETKHILGVVCATGGLSSSRPAILYEMQAAIRVCDQISDSWSPESKWSQPQVIPIVTAPAKKLASSRARLGEFTIGELGCTDASV